MNEQKQYKITLGILIAITCFLGCISLLIGQFGMTIVETLKCLFNYSMKDSPETVQLKKIIFGIRVPRTLSAVLIGGSLAVSGLTYQCVFRNRLASQDVLGVSTGACVGAAIGIICNLTTANIQLLSFTCGMFTIAVVFILAKLVKGDRTLSLVLAGVLTGGIMSSILGLIKYLANPETHLQTIVFWTMGDISSVSLKQLSTIIIPVTISLIIIVINRWNLNYFCYSDNEAKNLGVNINILRYVLIVSATIIIASDVSVAGSIGWIGLSIPQLARILVGNNNKCTVLTSFFLGSAFLLTVDITNRIISTAELPISIISGIIGLPLFVLCLYSRNKVEKI